MGILKFFTINNLSNDPVFFFFTEKKRDKYFKDNIDVSSRMYCDTMNIKIMDAIPGMKLIIKEENHDTTGA